MKFARDAFRAFRTLTLVKREELPAILREVIKPRAAIPPNGRVSVDCGLGQPVIPLRQGLKSERRVQSSGRFNDAKPPSSIWRRWDFIPIQSFQVKSGCSRLVGAVQCGRDYGFE